MEYAEGTCQQCGAELNDKEADDGLCTACLVENAR